MNSNICKPSSGDSNVNKKRVSSPKLSRLPLYNSNPNLHQGRPASPSLIPIKGETQGSRGARVYSIVEHELSDEGGYTVSVEGHVLLSFFCLSCNNSSFCSCAMPCFPYCMPESGILSSLLLTGSWKSLLCDGEWVNLMYRVYILHRGANTPRKCHLFCSMQTSFWYSKKRSR